MYILANLEPSVLSFGCRAQHGFKFLPALIQISPDFSHTIGINKVVFLGPANSLATSQHRMNVATYPSELKWRGSCSHQSYIGFVRTVTRTVREMGQMRPTGAPTKNSLGGRRRGRKPSRRNSKGGSRQCPLEGFEVVVGSMEYSQLR
jgi:hypothetical protein